MLHTLGERERLIGVAYAGGWLALLAAVVLCLWLGAGIFWQLFPAESETRPLAGIDPGDLSGADRAAGEVDLASLHLFGQSLLGVSLPVTAGAPDTSLDLKLVGTLVSEDAGAGIAIIANSDGETLYAVGDRVPGDARVHEVHPDRVILIHAGRYETLRLRSEDQDAPRRRQVAGNGGPAAAQAGQLSNLQRMDWQAVQSAQRLDPARLAQQVRALPIIEDGKAIGFRLQAGRDAALIGKLGLRSTDIITAVNGIPLNDASRAFELINQLNSQTQFSVDLRRDGRPMSLNIDANQLKE